MAKLPNTLIEAVRSQRAVLFLGAGATYGAQHPSGAKIPTADALKGQLCDQFLGGNLKDHSLSAVADYVINEIGLIRMQDHIKALFEPFQPADFHRMLPTFRWRAIASTNYDLIIDTAYKDDTDRLQDLVPFWKDGQGFDEQLRRHLHPVEFLKLHGSIDHHTDESIPFILSSEQYGKYKLNRTRLYGRLRDLAHEYHLIFCGYRIEDPHIREILFDLTDAGIGRPLYFRVSPSISDYEERYWSKHRVASVTCTFEEFLRELDKAIALNTRKLAIAIGGGKLSTRKFYRVSNAAESLTLATFLEQDVQHIYSGMPNSSQDARDFYRGYDKGFGCIAQNLDAQRVVMDSLLVDGFLFDENERKGVEFYLLKGPAGNGKTILLKRTSWDAANTYNKLVLFLRDGGAIRFEALKELHALTGRRIFLFVDRAALMRVQIKSILDTCRAEKLPLTLVTAERANEWNVYCAFLEKYVTQDFPVEYLTKPEIKQLIELLERHKSLGQLQYATPDQRVQAFEKVAQRQLLVALHEITSGTPFETLLKEEFERIEPHEARELYLDICTLHQFGAKVRAGLIARVTGISFAEFDKRMIKPLEDVVVVTEDPYTHDYYYSARHQHVAELVFSQMLPSPEDRYDRLTELMFGINPDYSSDRDTFERMIKGREVARAITSVDLGRLFYDKANEVSPNNAFVWHQRAVFERWHNDGTLELAEKNAGQAHDLNPTNRSIEHTQADIARRLALKQSDHLQRTAYRKASREKLNKFSSEGSEYDLHTRCLLALDELKDALDEAKEDDVSSSRQIVEVTKEAETTILGARRLFPESSEILTAEARYKELMRDSTSALKILEKAYSRNPRQDWLAVRVANGYVEKGRKTDAITVLRKSLAENPTGKLAHLELGFLLANDADAKVAADHFAKAYRPGDGNFDAQFWHARQLFVLGDYARSKQLFTDLNERAPDKFRHRADGTMLTRQGTTRRYAGEIDRKEVGYGFVSLTDLPDKIFASRADSDRDEWTCLSRGSKVLASVEFNRRGPRAIDIRSAQSTV